MPRFILPLLLALAGLILFGQGAYIHAKALLAQVLLERAFEKTIATGRETKPWSWADTWPVARIEVKRIHASAIVLVQAAAARRSPSVRAMSNARPMPASAASPSIPRTATRISPS